MIRYCGCARSFYLTNANFSILRVKCFTTFLLFFIVRRVKVGCCQRMRSFYCFIFLSLVMDLSKVKLSFVVLLPIPVGNLSMQLLNRSNDETSWIHHLTMIKILCECFSFDFTIDRWKIHINMNDQYRSRFKTDFHR